MKLNLYFDNGATSYPKPKELEQAAISYLQRGGNYGRASYSRAIENVRIVERCRDSIGDLMGVESDNIIFTKHATEAASLIIKGLELKGKRVLVSPMEHNAIMRPLQSCGAKIEVMRGLSDGTIDLEWLAKCDLSDVKLLCINHASNVNGVIQPLDDIADIIGNNSELFVDLSQSLGAITPPHSADFMVFTGHKSLYGPTGIGGAYIKKPNNVKPLVYGGTGSNSESFDMPNSLPDKFEAGTPNIIGIEMLQAALDNHPAMAHTKDDFANLLDCIRSLKRIKLYSSSNFEQQSELFSIQHKCISVARLAQLLWDNYKIEIRKGLHCAPLAHRSLGTFGEGTVRFSLSAYHTTDDLYYLCSVLKEICVKY